MGQSLLRLLHRCAEFIKQNQLSHVPRRLRGIYVLYEYEPARGRRVERYNLVYVGMARSGRGGGIRGRLITHRRRKGHLWTHFSVFEVWDNIRDDEVKELEGLFRHIYRRDGRANRLNLQRGFKTLRKVREASGPIESWSIPPKTLR
jgi:hypothetical protein